MMAFESIKKQFKVIIPLVVVVLLFIAGFFMQLAIYNAGEFGNFFFWDIARNFLGKENEYNSALLVTLVCVSIIIFFYISIKTKYEYNTNNEPLMNLISCDGSKLNKKSILVFLIIEITLILYIVVKYFILNSYNGLDILIWLLTIIVPAVGIYLYEYKVPSYTKLRLSKDEVFFIFCAFGFLLSISLPSLAQIPFVVHYDEATIGNLAREFVGNKINIFSLNKWYGYPNLSFYPAYLVLNYISNNLWGLRLYGVITILFSVIPFYYLARFMFNKEIAAIASIIMYSGHCFFYFFRNGMYHTDGLIIYSVVCFLFIAGMKMNSRLFIYLSGVFCALGFYVYMSARVMIIIILLYMFLIFVITLKKNLLLKQLSLLLVGFLICILPLGINIIKNPELSILRAGQINILTSDLAYKHATGRYKMDSDNLTLLNTLVNHLWISARSFNYGKDSDRQYSIVRPFLDLITSFFFLLALPLVCVFIFKFKKQKWFIEINDERYLLLGLSFWIILILAWVVNVDPPTYQKMPILMPVLSILCALALYNIAYYMIKNLASPLIKRIIKSGFICIILIGVIIANFEVFLHSGTFGLERNDFYLTDTVLSYYANNKAKIDGKAEFYLIGFRENLSFSLDFLRDKAVKYEYISNDNLKKSIPIIKYVNEDKYFIINPRYDTNCMGINYLNKYYPGGKTRIIKNLQNHVMFILYYVPKLEVNRAIKEVGVK